MTVECATIKVQDKMKVKNKRESFYYKFRRRGGILTWFLRKHRGRGEEEEEDDGDDGGWENPNKFLSQKFLLG